ncbi:MAG: DUF6263 family protein [Candidatus Kapaibacterium sp.]
MFFPIFLSSCSKEGSAPQGSSNAVFDSSQTAKAVTVTEKEHRIYIRPKVGNSYYYRIVQHSTSMSNGSAPGQPDAHRSASTDNFIYVHQTIRGIRADSSIDMMFKFDSMSVKAMQDTIKVDLSSNRAADRNDPRFASFAALLGEDIGVIITKFGDVKEVYGTTNIIEKIMKPYPDSVKIKEGEFIKNQINARIGQYVLETLMHYPDQPLAKDSTQKKDYEDNIPVAASVQFPMQISIRQSLTGFEERNDKVLAIFSTISTARPVRSVIEEGPVKATLQNFTMSTKEDIRVEDPTGMLVYRNVIEEKTYSLNIESSQAAGKTIQTDEKAKSTTKVELLK